MRVSEVVENYIFSTFKSTLDALPLFNALV
jgi:hypothetical protein